MKVATRRANRFLDHGANVKLYGSSISSQLKQKGAVLCCEGDIDELVEWSDLVVVASGDREMSDYVCGIAKDKLVNRADFPQEGDIIVPDVVGNTIDLAKDILDEKKRGHRPATEDYLLTGKLC